MQDATLYANGRVLTMAGAPAPALLVGDGRVVATGTAADLRRRAGTAALRTVDLGGATVLPGLVDTHPHLMHFGVLGAPLVDLADATSHADIVARIAARARKTPA